MTLCRFFLQGNCRYGENCRFQHQINHDHNYGSSAGPTRPQPSSSTTNDTNTLIRSIITDMSAAAKGNQWPLSSYTPFKDKSPFPGFEDQCFEEIRWGFYNAAKMNTVEQFKQNYQMAVQQAMLRIKSLASPAGDTLEMIGTLYGDQQQQRTTTSNSIFGGGASNFNQMQQKSSTIASSIFAQANQTLFGGNPNNQVTAATTGGFLVGSQGNSSVFGGGNTAIIPTQQQQIPSNNNIFGASTTPNTPFFAANNNNAQQPMAFGQLPPPQPPQSQQQNFSFQQAFNQATFPSGGGVTNSSNSVFGNPSNNNTVVGNNQTANIFQQQQQQQAMPATVNLLQDNNSLDFYSKIEDLSADEIAAFQSGDFDLFKLPNKPPTFEMCFR